MVRPTIPFASETIEINNVQQDTSPLYIQLSLPENASCENPSSGTVKQCSTIINSWRNNEKHMYDDQNNWKKIYTIPIINSEGLGYYVPHHTLSLRFQTGNVNGQGAQMQMHLCIMFRQALYFKSKNTKYIVHPIKQKYLFVTGKIVFFSGICCRKE